MFFRSWRFAVGVMLLLSTRAFASAPISIQYSLISLGGNVYQYVYSITNNGSIEGGAPIKLFDILFDTTLYQGSSLAIVTPNPLHSQWDEILLTAIPPAISALYDAKALQGGIPAGSTVSGFSVQFTWLGQGVPGSQPFEIFDPITFQELQSGTTVSAASVPMGSTLSLVLIGVGLMLIVAYQMRVQNSRHARFGARLE